MNERKIDITLLFPVHFISNCVKDLYTSPSPVFFSFHSCTRTRNRVARTTDASIQHDVTAKRSGCCLRSLIVIQEVARYHLHNTWARTKSCIIPSSLAQPRYRFSLYFPLFPDWKKRRGIYSCRLSHTPNPYFFQICARQASSLSIVGLLTKIRPVVFWHIYFTSIHVIFAIEL